MALFPSVNQCREAADSFVQEQHLISTDADYIGKLIYIYRLEWERRFGSALDESNIDHEGVPSIEDQLWECSGPVAELMDPDADIIRIYFLLLQFIKSRSADEVRPFRYVANAGRESIVYE